MRIPVQVIYETNISVHETYHRIGAVLCGVAAYTNPPA